eukprot:gene4878-5518_t
MATSILDTTNFPLYAVNVIDEDHFLVAGGGGASKTGVPNAIAFYKICQDGSKLKASKLFQYEVGKQAIMNLDINAPQQTFVAGMDNKCRLYRYAIKGSKKKDAPEECVVKEIGCQTTAAGSEHDGDDGDEYQKCVKFSADTKLIVTGSSDGQITILKYPTLDIVRDFQAHSGEVDDLDFHPNSKRFISVSRDGTACLWNTENGQKEIELQFSAENEDDSLLRFRNCRFTFNIDDKDTHLYTTHVQAKFTKSTPLPNYLVSWDLKKWIPKRSVALPKQNICQLAVSPGGRYVAIGTADGSVSIYIAWNLRLLRTVSELHNIFVTGLAFLPDSKMINEGMKQDLALLSVSVDNTCHITTVAKRSEYSFSFLIFLFVAVICLLFALLSQFDVQF